MTSVEGSALEGLEVRLASRPTGWPTAANFRVERVTVPAPQAGQVLVRNTFCSVDPYMRGRMDDRESYVPPFALGTVMDGGAVGTVVASEDPDLAPGDSVLHDLGWREYAIADGRAFRRVDASVAPAQAYLGVLGMPGLTAYTGLVDIAQLHDDETVFVSGAAGAVGSVAGQLAHLRGARRVIGSAGSAEKVSYLTERLGFDAAFNYKDAPVAEQLADAAPEGIDVYFDNVGGEHLEAALGALRVHGRAALCGAISGYNETSAPPGPRNLFLAVTKRLTLRGFLVIDHAHLRDAFIREVGPAFRDGAITFQETVVEGLENAPDAFIGMLRGDNIGKMLVRVG